MSGVIRGRIEVNLMNAYLNKLRIVSITAILIVFGNLPAMAEDIDIYLQENNGSTAIKPNVLFILDTSTSMDENILIEENFSSSLNYTTKVGDCYDNDYFYMVDDTTTVTCENVNTFDSFKSTQNQCAAAARRFGVFGVDADYTANDSNLVTGIYQYDDWVMWYPSTDKWYELNDSKSQDTYFLECAADQGIHGTSTSGEAIYIGAQGSGASHTVDSAGEFTTWDSLPSLSKKMVSGNYMNYLVTSVKVEQVKIDVMKNVISNLVAIVEGVEVGLMKLNAADGGTIRYEVQEASLSRNNMISQMNTWSATDMSTLTESLYEAYRYYAGQDPLYADNNLVGSATTNTGNYKSPIDPATAQCQRQFVIMLTGGGPEGDEEANSLIEDLPGFTGAGGTPGQCNGVGVQKNADIWEASADYANGKCLDDLAKYMNDYGLTATLEGGTTAQDVKISTYTVGFDFDDVLGPDEQLIEDAGNVGGGEHLITDSSSGLLETLISIMNEIKGVHSTFSSPAVSVNAFNRTTHRSDLYFTLFKPSTKSNWKGNLKRFKLVFVDGNPEIQDVNNASAINSTTGFFKDDAHSYWTPLADAPDGKDTRKGGAASKLSLSRNFYSNLGNSTILSAAENAVNTTNLSKDFMGVPLATDADFTSLINWVRGIDVMNEDGDEETTDARRLMGDPLHSQPALIQYGGTDADPAIVAYVGTNEGYLHAIDTRLNYGSEIFSFIPAELLPKMNSIKNNIGTATVDGKTYGVDGSVVPWVIDVDNDGTIESADGDKVYIYFGMRRGGSRVVDVGGVNKKVGSYYAMDVTDHANPALIWKIDGGIGDFTELGQTWSKPVVRSMMIGGVIKKVLIFGAGYDTAQDTVTVRTADAIGRGIFIVNAITGERLWHAGPSNTADLILADMQYSVPSDISAVDTNGDGLMDRIYVGDMGGQIWRFDINNVVGATSSVMTSTVAGAVEIMSGGRIADLADVTTSTNRKFFYAPDAAIMQTSTASSYIALLITSGNRSKAISRGIVQDRVFMIRDLPVHVKPDSYVTITENDTTHDLFDTTANLIGQGDGLFGADTQAIIDTATGLLAAANGWYINFDMTNGEKGLSKPLIFGGEAYFTTYEPVDPANQDASSCTPNEGSGYLYHIAVADGTPVRNYNTVVLNSDENLTKEDRVVVLDRSGIPAEPRVIMPDGTNTAICVSTECDKLEQTTKHKTLYWYER